ncbi:unnamed protein product [Hymenolepis diminuta]|uniref:Uncharacterized protein n=1 Tax=Hymenolepis diminuta TaxID=6216 RepID=A0A564Y1T1_HYMDI|nr:unnamed protein product [Hymenolepis diminuta]VUZ45391.1 unnamed protein product [Hymenolepis diminuta]VUZ45394.1 unnamed protein product [Hymenolepis diminuta]
MVILYTITNLLELDNNVRLSVTGSHTSCSSPLFLSTLSYLLSLSLCHSFQTRCGFLEYIFGLINSCCSALQLFLAIT